MALTKVIEATTAGDGVHTLTVSDVARLKVGMTIGVRGCGEHYDGEHTISEIDQDELTVSFAGAEELPVVEVIGLLDAPVSWITSADVEGALGVAPATELDELWLDECVHSAQEWVFARREKSGYLDFPSLVPNASVKRGTIAKALQEYRERGSVESVLGYPESPISALVGGGLPEILRAIECNRPRFG
jgi:hypothetical protein